MEKIPLWFSFLFLAGGLILIGDISLSKITGNVIAETPSLGISSIGFLFLILGIVLFVVAQESRLERNLALEIKKSGRVIDKPKELLHVAKKMGYDLRKPVREGIPVYSSSGDYITVIPTHAVSPGVSRGIISELAKGESTFRKRNY